MQSRAARYSLLSAGALLLCLHALLDFRFPQSADIFANLFYIFWTLAALITCIYRSNRVPVMRRSWRLVALALLLWCVATVSSEWSEFVEHASLRSATIDDFFYFFYGVPILLAIAASDDTESAPLFFWMDGLQSAALGLLAYIDFFHAIPFSGARIHPMTVEQLVWVFDAENVLLIVLSTARMWVTSPRSPEKRFFQILCGFLWLYGVSVAVNNHLFALYSSAGSIDYIVDLPFAALTFAVLLVPATVRARTAKRRTNGPAARVLDNARHVLLGLALVLFAASIAREEFNVAMGAILGAFAIYGIRSVYLQSRYQKTQMELEAARDRLQQIALQDGLTGVANRRCFDERLEQEWERAGRSQQPLSVLLIDIDHFKKLNDTFGHMGGDECLVQVAQTLRAAVARPGDLMARYGGEEFVAILPETDGAGARRVADRLQRALRDSVPIPALERQVTVSIGSCTWEAGQGGSAQNLVQCADRALYAAKQNGRNRVESSPFTAS